MNWVLTILISSLILVASIIVIVWYELSFKHYAVERTVVNGRKILLFDRFKEKRDKEGNVWYMLKKMRATELRNLPIPPSEAIEVTTKGKKAIEFCRTETNDVIYLRDDNTFRPFPYELLNDVPQEIIKIEDPQKKANAISKWQAQVYGAWKQENQVTATFKPFTTNHRQILINQYKKANAKRGKNWRESIPQIVAIAGIVILVIALLVFWGDLAKPVLDMKDKQTASQRIELETLEIIKELKQDVQTIRGEQGEAPPG